MGKDTMLQQARNRDRGRVGQGHDHPGLRQGRDRGIEAPAGAGRLLGALVRPLQAAHPDPRKGGHGRQGQGQAGQDEHRRASGDPGPDGHPVDPGRDRLRQRPAGRRLHGRAAGKPGHRLPRAADQGRHRRRARTRKCCKRPKRRWPRAMPPARREIYARGARGGRRQHRRRWPGWRAATSRPARSIRPSRRWPWCRKPSATTPRSRRRAPRSSSPSRPRRSARSTELEQKVAANPLDHQARFDLALALNGQRQARRGDSSS